MWLLGTAAQKLVLVQERLLAAQRGEAEFRLCGKAGGSTPAHHTLQNKSAAHGM